MEAYISVAQFGINSCSVSSLSSVFLVKGVFLNQKGYEIWVVKVSTPPRSTILIVIFEFDLSDKVVMMPSLETLNKPIV